MGRHPQRASDGDPLLRRSPSPCESHLPPPGAAAVGELHRPDARSDVKAETPRFIEDESAVRNLRDNPHDRHEHTCDYRVTYEHGPG